MTHPLQLQHDLRIDAGLHGNTAVPHPLPARCVEALLGIEMEDLSDLIIRSEHPIEISSMCTIFAESEIISYVSGGTAMEDIAAGTGYAIARRIVAQGQAARIPMKEQIIFSGGVAHNEGIRRIFEDLTGHKIIAAKDPQCTAALGAAVTALKAYEKK